MSTIMADLFLLLLTPSGCVFLSCTIATDMFPPFFIYQQVRIYISWAVQSSLTFSRCFWLSVSAYSHFMSCTIMADMFLPLLTHSECVFPFHEQRNYGWYVSPISIIRKLVTPFHSRYHQGWLVPAGLNYQEVCISIPWATQSQLTCSCHFQLPGSA